MPSQTLDSATATPDDVRMAIGRAVAGRQLPDAAITALAKKLASTKFPIRAIDVCTHGICIDYVFHDERWAQAVKDIVAMKGVGIHSITVFPWGIPFPDIFRVRVEHRVDGVANVGALADR
jgi:hypothetical protein